MKTINLEIQVPDWVTHYATDDEGVTVVFSAEPEPQDDGWWRLEDGHCMTITIGRLACPNWRKSLRKV